MHEQHRWLTHGALDDHHDDALRAPGPQGGPDLIRALDSLAVATAWQQEGASKKNSVENS